MYGSALLACTSRGKLYLPHVFLYFDLCASFFGSRKCQIKMQIARVNAQLFPFCFPKLKGKIKMSSSSPMHVYLIKNDFHIPVFSLACTIRNDYRYGN